MKSDRVSDFSPVARTLLIPLVYRALESRRPDGILRDERAVTLAAKLGYSIPRLARGGLDQATTIVRTCRFDRFAREFLARRPEGTVVDIGCGLDTRFDRLDNGRLHWVGVDLPDVIALRRELIPETPRSRLIAASVVEPEWLSEIEGHRPPVFFLAEGVFPYLAEIDVKRAVLSLAGRLPGSGLVFDALSRFSVWLHSHTHRGLRQSGAQLRWGLEDPRALEAWAPSIHLLEEWFYFDDDEPRLRPYRWIRHIPILAKGNFILHYRLGDPPDARMRLGARTPAA